MKDLKKLRFACDTDIVTKTREDLQDMAKKVVDTGRKYGTEMNLTNHKR